MRNLLKIVANLLKNCCKSVLTMHHRTRADTDYGSYRRVAGKRSWSSTSPKSPLAKAKPVFQQFPLEHLHREIYIENFRQDVDGSDGEIGNTCRYSGENHLNSDPLMTLSHFDAQEDPRSPFFAPRSLAMKRTLTAGKRSLLPEWPMTSKREEEVEEVPRIRLKWRRAGRG